MNSELIGILAHWVNERHSIYLRKKSGEPKPWTKDSILRKYKFTNVFRELDTVSQWLIHNWYEPYREHTNLWFAACMARQINWPATLEEIGFPEFWDKEKTIQTMIARKDRGEKVYTGAYMLRCDIQKGGGHKARYTCCNVLDPLWKDKDRVLSDMGSVQRFVENLKTYHGWGGFLADQVAWDLTWTNVLREAPDAQTWTYAGPGCIRGLNRLSERSLVFHLTQEKALEELHKLYEEVYPYLDVHVLEYRRPTIRDLENVCCEFDKYMRVKLNEGRPRSLYQGER